MQSHNVYSSFITQSNLENVINSCSDEKKEQNFYFRQFTGAENEVNVIASFIKKMTPSARELIVKLETDQAADGKRLSGFVKRLLSLISSYADEEAYTANYLNTLSTQLRPFLLV